MKRYSAIPLSILLMLWTSGCTAGTSAPADSTADISTLITESTDRMEYTGTNAPDSTTAPEGTVTTPAAPQYQNNSAGGGYIAETERYRFYIDRDILYRLDRASDSAAVLLSIEGMAQLNAADESTLYCTSPKGIYRIHAETGEAELVCPVTLISGPWISLIVTGETVYFSDGVTLRSCGLDFQNPTTLFTAEQLYIDQLLYANDTLYFSAYRPSSGSGEADEQSGVFACLPEAVVQIYHGYCAGIAHSGDGLCISAPKEQALLHLPYGADDTENTVLCEGQFGSLCATPYGIVANDAAMNIVLVDADTKEIVNLGAGYCLNAAEDALYYLALRDGTLCRIPFTEMQAVAAP